MARVLSVLALSTTTHWSANRTDSRHACKLASSFFVMMMTDRVMGARVLVNVASTAALI